MSEPNEPRGADPENEERPRQRPRSEERHPDQGHPVDPDAPGRTLVEPDAPAVEPNEPA